MGIFRSTTFAMAFCSLALTLSQQAKANAVYTYTGQNYVSVSDYPTLGLNDFSTSDFISASITFASPLPDNLGLGSNDVQYDVDESAAILTWNITDQVYTLTPANSVLTTADFGTNAEGDIDLWNLNANETTSSIFLNISTTGTDPATNGLDQSSIYYYAFGLGPAASTSLTGTWQNASSTTPEPSTTVLLSLGGAVLLCVIRRGNHRQ
jgi:hypothetical protein